MRATRVFLGSEVIVFAIFFSGLFARLHQDVAGPLTLGAFELSGVVVSFYLLSRGQGGNASLLDWLGCALAIAVASVGYAGIAITLFALYLFFRDRHDLYTRAAGTVVAAVIVQAVWAPLVFSKISFLLLQIDAGIVGSLVSLVLPGASWSGTIVSTPSGHDVAICEPCASFHNLSLASLCWVTLTMLHRPYWSKGDLFIGVMSAFIQFGFNIWRLVFVCLSLPMYQFWHEGSGKHIFSAVATATAIVFIQTSLVRLDRRNQRIPLAVSP